MFLEAVDDARIWKSSLGLLSDDDLFKRYDMAHQRREPYEMRRCHNEWNRRYLRVYRGVKRKYYMQVPYHSFSLMYREYLERLTIP